MPLPLELSSKEWLWVDTKSKESGGHVGNAEKNHQSGFKTIFSLKETLSVVLVFFSSGKVLLKLLEHKQTQAWGSGMLPEKVALMKSRRL